MIEEGKPEDWKDICNYPDCNCQIDMGADGRCAIGHQRSEKSMTDNVIKMRPADDPDEVLQQAKGAYSDVLIIGYSNDGTLEVRANNIDSTVCLMLVEQFKKNLLDGVYSDE